LFSSVYLSVTDHVLAYHQIPSLHICASLGFDNRIILGDVYDVKKEFQVSAGIYPGSSGSTVFLVDDNFYKKIPKFLFYKKIPKKVKEIKRDCWISEGGKILKSIPGIQFATSTVDDRTIISALRDKTLS
jgi:hypothetical protein